MGVASARIVPSAPGTRRNSQGDEEQVEQRNRRQRREPGRQTGPRRPVPEHRFDEGRLVGDQRRVMRVRPLTGAKASTATRAEEPVVPDRPTRKPPYRAVLAVVRVPEGGGDAGRRLQQEHGCEDEQERQCETARIEKDGW